MAGGSSSTPRRCRFSLRSIFGSTPPHTFTQLAARLVDRQDASPEPVRHASWDAESGAHGRRSRDALPPSLAATTGGAPIAGSSNSRNRSTLSAACSSRSQEQLQAAAAQNSPSPPFDPATLECPLCLLELPSDCLPKLTLCPHRACRECLHRYMHLEISEGRANVGCPECSEALHPNDIRRILLDAGSSTALASPHGNDGGPASAAAFSASGPAGGSAAARLLLAKYEEFMLRRVLATDRDARWCPAPDCTFVVIANNCATCPKLRCERPGCDTEFCYHCKQVWHPNITCDMARQQRQDTVTGTGSSSNVCTSFPPTFPFPSTSTGITKGGSSGASSSGMKLIGNEEMKNCPSCGMQIIKADDGSCNHMTCGICGKEFCWLCLKQITDLHYLSPSGCTFWGKKPWSRKKKILWQLGMLVGAPVGIALIAGIAIPGIIIGIPVFVGKRMYVRNRDKSVFKRNASVTLGVLLSMVFSPIVAAIAVGIGVPILLAYAYGVVPLILIRSGGCGVKASSSGVRLQFDDEGPSDSRSVGPDERKRPFVEAAVSGASLSSRESRDRANSQGAIMIQSTSSVHSGSSQQLQQQLRRGSPRPLAGASFVGMDEHASISIGDVDSMVSGRTQESASDVGAVTAVGKVQIITVQIEEPDRASQGSTKALAGSLLNYDPPCK